MIMETLRTVSTVEELRELPHQAVILHPGGWAAQVIEVANGQPMLTRRWFGIHINDSKHGTPSRSTNPNVLGAEEFLVQWLGFSGGAYTVLHEGTTEVREGARATYGAVEW